MLIKHKAESISLVSLHTVTAAGFPWRNSGMHMIVVK